MTDQNSECEKIILYLKDLREKGEGWVLEGNLRSFATPYGWIGFRGDRNVRDLVEVGILDWRRDEKGFAEVRFRTRPEIREAIKTLFLLTERKQRFQERMYKFIREITLTREEYERCLSLGLQP